MTESLIAKYKGKGFKLTPQRLAILEFLDGNTSHPTAEDIYRAIKKRFPTLSFATVYNTLQLLKNTCDIWEVTIDPKRRHYDPNTETHHHIGCMECGKIEDVFIDYSKVLTLPKYLSKGFKIKIIHVDFQGLCQVCQKKERKR